MRLVPEEDTLPLAPKVTAVIPAYNESGRIGRVLAALRDVGEIGHIIVVDDGSADTTAAEVIEAAEADPRIHCLRLLTNSGKGAAMFAGARAASEQSVAGRHLLLFLDADLIGLTAAHIQALVDPVATGKVEMTIGIFHSRHLHTAAAHWLTPWLSGQRCLTIEQFFQVGEQEAAGYGIETAITQIARQQGWRCQHVSLEGVSHPSQEIRYGLRSGLKKRFSMYHEIWQAIQVAWRLGPGHRSRFLSRFTRESNKDRSGRPPRTRLKLLLFLLLLSTIFAYNYDRTRAFSSLRPEDIPLLSLDGVQRLLVIAPHPDDETLGAAGAIQQVLEAGGDVKVIVMTNGDGQAVAPLVLQRKVRVRAEDYIQTGEQRQMETLNALQLLGMTPDGVLFLGYPDGRLNQLWMNDWRQGCPLQARYTRTSHSLYATTFNPHATYCGRDVLDDLQTIIEEYRPDLVLLPHPNDEHPDHRASSNFARMALALVKEADPSYQPVVWGYLVHYGLYPQPRGRHSQASLRPPSPLTGSQNQWARLELTPDQAEVKASAVQAYPSQIRLLGSFLPSFVRQNELFAQVNILDVSLLTLVDFPVNATGLIESPTLPEPADESTRRRVVGSADLVGLHVARVDNLLWLTAETRHALFPGVRYTLMVKLPNGDTLTATWPGNASRLSANTFTFPLNLDEIDNQEAEEETPLSMLAFAAEVRQGIVLDRTAWHFIMLSDQLP